MYIRTSHLFVSGPLASPRPWIHPGSLSAIWLASDALNHLPRVALRCERPFFAAVELRVFPQRNGQRKQSRGPSGPAASRSLGWGNDEKLNRPSQGCNALCLVCRGMLRHAQAAQAKSPLSLVFAASSLAHLRSLCVAAAVFMHRTTRTGLSKVPVL